MKPKVTPKRFWKATRKDAAKVLPKCAKRVPKMTPKRTLKSKKNVLGTLFFNSKKAYFSEAVFPLFLLSPGGPGPWKSSQNVVMVCKNEGPSFSPKNQILSRNVAKMTSLGTLKTSRNHKKTRKKPFQKRPEKTHRKNH